MSSQTEVVAGIERPGLQESLTAVSTPAVLIVSDVVDANIAHMVALAGGPDRARPHIKTARTAWTVGRLRHAGLTKVKASTAAEAALAIRAGMADVLLAYPAIGPQLAAMGGLAAAHPDRSVSVLVDSPEAIREWPNSRLHAFLDLDSGLGRTGVPVEDRPAVEALLAELAAAGVTVKGIHAYDGHLAGPSTPEQEGRVRRGLEPVISITRALDLAELVVGGSHTFLPGMAACDDAGLGDIVTGSPGTVVYCDHRSLSRFGPATGFRPAAFVVSRVVSTRRAGSFTVDAGLTAIQVDAGHPHFVVPGHPDFAAGDAAQEHAAIICSPNRQPAVGTLLSLLPFHVDTAIAQFSQVLVWEDGVGLRREPVRHRHGTVSVSLDA